MQKARRNYITGAFWAESALKSCSVPKWSPWLTLRASSQLPPFPFHPSTPPGRPLTPSSGPPAPLEQPLTSSSAWEVPWSPGMARSPWPTETSRTGRPRKKSAFRGLKIRRGLCEIMTIPSLTACRTNCKAHLPDPGFPL